MNYDGPSKLQDLERAMSERMSENAGEPDIVRVARAFDEAQREMQLIDQQRRKLDKAYQDAQIRFNEHAQHLRAMIDMPMTAERTR